LESAVSIHASRAVPNPSKPSSFLVTGNTVIDAYLAKEKPDIVIVQGDTTTVFCAFYHKIPVGHVEAGLRTGNKYSPFPEEANRVLATHLSALHFAPTQMARQNLLQEGIASPLSPDSSRLTRLPPSSVRKLRRRLPEHLQSH
jgi:UDP-N-acetylglucosamine 2-epimerase